MKDIYFLFIFFVYRYVEPFRSYALPTDDGSAKFDVPPHFRDGVNIFRNWVLRLDPAPNLCAYFWGDPLKDC